MISIIFTLIFGNDSIISTVQAVPTTKEVYQNTPPGMSKISDLMDIPATYTGTTNMNNSAHIIKTGDATYQNTADIIELIKDSGSTNQLGSAWGKVNGTNDNKSFNYLDLTKKQTISAWFYMGNSVSAAPDGLAFVLQNDAKGANAISQYNGSLKSGETLGVWGGSASPTILSTPLSLEKNAIQNSFAIEFDPLLNKEIPTSSFGKDDSFDSKRSGSDFDIKGQHVAWNYPGDSSTYVPQTLNFIYKYYELNHNLLAGNTYLSGYDDALTGASVKYSWRNFIINYTPPASGSTQATIQYYINRKYYDGTLKPFANWDGKTFNIDISKFKATDKKVRWGFTAANGSPNSTSQPIAVVMESMPSVADIATNVTMLDLTQDGREIKDLDKNPTADSNVNDGDKLNLKYSLTYASGIIGTGTLKTQIGLPQNVNFTVDSNGNIGTISYKNKSGTITTQNISASTLGTATNTNNTTINVVNLNLTSLDDTNNTNIIVSLNGTAKAPTSTTPQTITVNQEHTSFRSDYYSGDIMSPKFLLNNEVLSATSTSSTSQSIKYDDYAKLQGTLKYLKGSNFSGDNLSATILVDNNQKIIKNDVAVSKGATQGTFNITDLTGAILTPGDHTVSLTFTDSGHRVSNTLNYAIKVADYKNLLISATTSNLNQTVNQDSDTNLTGSLNYDDNSSFLASNMTLYWSIDNGTATTQTLGGNGQITTASFQYTVSKGLSVGTHAVTVYASDGVRKSNTLTYNLNVTDKKLILSPTDNNITINDNKTVTLNGTYQYSDGTSALATSGTFQVKNEGEAIQDPVTIGLEPDGNTKGSIGSGSLTINLDPIAKNKLGGSLDDYIAKKSGRLKVGRNEITVKVTDGVRDSNTVTYIVNVPKLTATITASSNTDYDITSINGQKLPLNFNYSDNSYKVAGYDLIANISTNGTLTYMKENKPNPDTSGTIPMDPTVVGLDPKQTETPQVVTFRYSDPYGRVTNTLTYNLKLVRTLLQLNVLPNYSFEDVKPLSNQNSLINRNGKWDISVRSFKSAWKLTAHSSDMIKTQGNTTTNMNAEIVFSNNGQIASLKDGTPTIASNSNTQGADTTFDVTNDWDNNKGIFLEPTGPLISGTYQGQINWDLINSV